MADADRKNITLFPDFDLEIDAGGITSSVGVRGASLNVRTSPAPADPGTSHRTAVYAAPDDALRDVVDYVYYLPGDHHLLEDELDAYLSDMEALHTRHAIRSARLEALGSAGMADLAVALDEAYRQRQRLAAERPGLRAQRQATHDELEALKRGTLSKHLRRDRIQALEAALFEQELAVLAVEDGIERSHIRVRINLPPPVLQAYRTLEQAFDALRHCHRIWDITSRIDALGFGSPIRKEVDRQQVSFSRTAVPLVETGFDPMHLENANGADLYLYPTFCLLFVSDTDFAFINLKELFIRFEPVDFFELASRLPDDAEVLRWRWQYVRDDGQPDPAAAENREIPVMAYGDLHLTTAAGLNERFMFSCRDRALAFQLAFARYLDALGPAAT